MVIGLQLLMLKQNNVNSQNLNICLSNNYVCLKISSENSNDSFFSNFILEKKIKTEFLSDFLDKILVDKNIYNKSIDDVTVHFDNELFSFVPNDLFDENHKKEYLKYITELKQDDFVSHDSINELDIKNVFLPYVNINNLLINKFKEINYFHYNSALLKKLVNENIKYGEKENLFCIISYKKLKIVVIKKNRLVFFNCFNYENSNDILYFLLSVCQNIDLNLNKISLNLILNYKVDNLTSEFDSFFTKIRIIFNSNESDQNYILS